MIVNTERLSVYPEYPRSAGPPAILPPQERSSPPHRTVLGLPEQPRRLDTHSIGLTSFTSLPLTNDTTFGTFSHDFDAIPVPRRQLSPFLSVDCSLFAL